MDPKSMEPLGRMLAAFLEGDAKAELVVRRDDGYDVPLPAAYFFRPEAEFNALENEAIHRCRGHVLDVGGGSGLHSLVLQEHGVRVTAIDVSPEAVDVMERRGVKDVQRADIFEYQGGPFDAILLLGHGVGMVEDLEGLDRLLTHVRGLVADGGQVLVESVDVRITDDPLHLEYVAANQRAGRYFGDTRIQCEFRGQAGPLCSWIHVAPRTLKEHAEKAGWLCRVPIRDDEGNYLGVLTRAAHTNSDTRRGASKHPS